MKHKMTRFHILSGIALMAVLCAGALFFGGSGNKTAMAVSLCVALSCFAYVFWCFSGYIKAIDLLKQNIADHEANLTMRSIDPVFDGFVSTIKKFWIDANKTNQDLEDKIETIRIQLELSKKQKTHTEAIIHSITDAVIVVDNLGRIAVANARAAELFDFELDKVVFKQIEQAISSSEISEKIRAGLVTKVSNKRGEIVISKEDRDHCFELILSGIFDKESQLKGVVAVFHDITREKEASQMKNDFVSHVSHELKTPLASITAYSEMLADGEAEDEKTRNEFLGVIQTQAQRLNRMIEGILNIARIESGMVKVNKENVSVPMIIKESCDMIKSYAAEKDITVNAPAAIMFGQVYADRDMISQVVINLLSNAVKYTPQGGRIDIHTEVNELDNTVKVNICDTGVGIPDSELPHVFDKFYRVSTNNKCAKGTGLGLNLVKQIVEKIHNGNIFVTSRQGEGSTFGFELKLANKSDSDEYVNQERTNDEKESIGG